MSDVLRLPERFTKDECFGVAESLRSVQNAPEVEVDFSPLRYSYPVSMLVIGAQLREFVAYRKARGLGTRALGIDPSNTAHSYLLHLGYFRFIGLPVGKDVGQAPGSNTYIPIQRLRMDELRSSVDLPYRRVDDVIAEETDGLARVLLGDESDIEMRKAIAYSLREVVRNVFDHAQASECYLSGQRWYDGSVQICIVDAGRGVRGSLAETYPELDGEEAIRSAVRPGFSRIRDPKKLEVSANSGYGLYVLAELGRECGWFTLGSDKYRITATPELYDDVAPERFTGTYVGLHLRRAITTDFRKRLSRIIYSGEAEARMLGTNPRASKRSRSL